MDTRSDRDNVVISKDEKIGAEEFKRRKRLVEGKVINPFFNFQFFTAEQEQHSELVEEEKNRDPYKKQG